MSRRHLVSSGDAGRAAAAEQSARLKLRLRLCRRDIRVGLVPLPWCAELLGGGQANLRPTPKDGMRLTGMWGGGVVRDRLSLAFVRVDPCSFYIEPHLRALPWFRCNFLDSD